MRGRQCLLAIVPVVLAACGGGHGVADRFSGAWRLQDGRTIPIRRVSAAVGRRAMRALRRRRARRALTEAAGALSQCEAVALFIERAQAVNGSFALTNDNAPAVAEICVRLDGLPLAIELAAARIRVLPPKSLLARLDHSLKLLTGGARDLPTRQQTLHATIDWSYRLLSGVEQRFFAQLSVFVGGWTLEAAEAVLERDVFDGLASLVEKSLVRQREGVASRASRCWRRSGSTRSNSCTICRLQTSSGMNTRTNPSTSRSRRSASSRVSPRRSGSIGSTETVRISTRR